MRHVGIYQHTISINLACQMILSWLLTKYWNVLTLYLVWITLSSPLNQGNVEQIKYYKSLFSEQTVRILHYVRIVLFETKMNLSLLLGLPKIISTVFSIVQQFLPVCNTLIIHCSRVLHFNLGLVHKCFKCTSIFSAPILLFHVPLGTDRGAILL